MHKAAFPARDLPCYPPKKWDRHLSVKDRVILGDILGSIKARYEDKVLKPLGDPGLEEGDEVEVIVPGSLTKKLYGIIKCWERADEALDEYGSNIH